MDSKFIAEAIQKYLYQRSYIYQALNFNRGGYMEADILAISNAMLVKEIEIKISRSDFKREAKDKAHKHQALKNPYLNPYHKTPNKYYFACPIGLLSKEDIPSHAGLIRVTEEGKVEMIIEAPKLHNIKADQKLLTGMLENLTAKTIFGCQYMTYKNKKNNLFLQSLTNDFGK